MFVLVKKVLLYKRSTPLNLNSQKKFHPNSLFYNLNNKPKNFFTEANIIERFSDFHLAAWTIIMKC